MSELQWDKEFAEEQSGGDAELLAELLDLLRDSSLSDLEKINNALAGGDADGVGDAAHSIKGAAASLGFDGIRDAAYVIEKQGRVGDLAAVDVTLLTDLLGQLDSI